MEVRRSRIDNPRAFTMNREPRLIDRRSHCNDHERFGYNHMPPINDRKPRINNRKSHIDNHVSQTVNDT